MKMRKMVVGMIAAAGMMAVAATAFGQSNLTVIRKSDNSIWKMMCYGTSTCSGWTMIGGKFSVQPTLTWDPSIQRYILVGIGNNQVTIWRTTFDVDGVWDGVWTNITGTSGGSPSPVAIAGGDTPGWSEFWISGNGIRKFHESDTTVIDMDTVGGAVVRQGAAAGSKNVMLPISIMAMSNGRTGTIHGVTVRWKTETASDKLVSILMRKQTGLCSTADCYVNIVNGIGENYDCDPSSHPHGCGILYSVNSPLESGSQIYLTLELSFASETNHIWIGGVQIGVSYQ